MLRAASLEGTSPITLHVYMYVIIFWVTAMGLRLGRAVGEKCTVISSRLYSRVAGTTLVSLALSNLRVRPALLSLHSYNSIQLPIWKAHHTILPKGIHTSAFSYFGC